MYDSVYTCIQHKILDSINYQLTINETLSVTPSEPVEIEYLRLDSSLLISGREGSILLSTGLGTLQLDPV